MSEFRTLDEVTAHRSAQFVAAGSESGRRWLADLPGLFAEVCRRWDLVPDDGPLHCGYNAVVIHVRREDAELVVKLTWPPESADAEARGLQAWAGQGTVLAVELDLPAGILLLERLDPTRTLHSLELFEAAAVAGALIRRLAIPSPGGFTQLRGIAAELAANLHERQQVHGSPVPKRWLDKAQGLALDLSDTPTADQLVHADLHYANVLAGTRQPWSAIDPRPVTGDPEYALPELMWTRASELADAASVRRLLDTLVGSATLNAELATAWVVVRCIDYWLWGLAHGWTEDPLRCRSIVDALT